MFFVKNKRWFQVVTFIFSRISLLGAVCFAAINLLLFGGVLYWLALNDQSSHPVYFLLAIIAIFVWAWEFGILVKHKIVLNHLLILAIPPLYIIMEFINFTGITKMTFYCQIYHYIFYGSLLLALDIIIRDVLNHSRLRSFLLLIHSVFLGALLLFPLLLITNVCLNKTGIDHDAMVAICQTDQEEALDYFFSNNGIPFLVIALILTILCIGLIRYWYFRKTSDRVSVRLVLFLLLPLVPFWIIGSVTNQFAYFMPLTWKTAWVPKGYYAQIKRYNQNIEKRKAYLAEQLKGEEQNKGNDGLFVVVIGESLNRNYMQCYGYHKETTPFQQQLLQTQTAFRFNECYGCHAMTVNVLPLLLTHRNQYDGMPITLDSAISIIDLLKYYGYRTAWFSNHYLYGADASTLPLVSQADTIVSLKDSNHDKNKQYDLDLLEPIEKFEPGNRAVIFLNLWGNHLPYATTYPKDFQAPDDYTPYEKSILYNDFVMQKFFEYFSQKNLQALIYVSDHSDAVSTGKGHDTRDRAFTREMVEIPCWIYLSPDYAQMHPDLVEKLQISTGKIVTNDLIFNVVLEILGIQNTFTPKHFLPLSEDYMVNSDNAATLWGKRLLFTPQPSTKFVKGK